MKNSNENDIAIVGIACRLPGAATAEEFWENLVSGKVSIDRDWTDCSPENPRTVYARGRIPDFDKFDAAFFNVTPSEASLIDPQQRVFLECAWHALEDAGVRRQGAGQKVGVYAGGSLSSYLVNEIIPRPDVRENYLSYLGNQPDLLALRVAFKLNLQGPAVTVQTACSTSLVAVHLACQSLLLGECDIAIAGGVSIKTDGEKGYIYERNGILSPDGSCRPFDARANGTVFSDGAAVVVLKRLDAAIANNDRIYSVVKGSSINNDGASKVSFTAPSAEGQASVIKDAHNLAEVAPRDISYIEAHGTGTALGDPVEISGLQEVFEAQGDTPLAIGSVKANIGHLDAAAGVAGLIKTCLMLKHRHIPPQPGFERLNPEISFAKGTFYVPDAPSSWGSPTGVLRAGVSSFGVGGTNAHVVLESPPAAPLENYTTVSQGSTIHILPLSAKSKNALVKSVIRLRNFLRSNQDCEMEDIAYSLQRRCSDFPFRTAFLVGDGESLFKLLDEWTEGQLDGVSCLGKSLAPSQLAHIEAWCQSDSMAWDNRWNIDGGKMISLPSYPFEKVKHWISDSLPKSQPSPEPNPAEAKLKLFNVVWQRGSRVLPAALELRGRKSWLVFAPTIELGDQVRKTLESFGQTVTVILPAGQYQRVSKGLYTLDPSNPDEFRKLTSDLRAYMRLPQKIIYMWSSSPVQSCAPRMPSTELVSSRFFGLISLWQALDRLSIKLEIDLTVVSENVFDVIGDEKICPANALVIGPIKAMMLESEARDVHFRSVAHLDLSDDSWIGELLTENTVKEVVRVCATLQSSNETAIRRGRRWTRHFTPRQGSTSSLLRPEGVYIIFGAFGGIGREISRAMAKRLPGVRLVLISRTGSSIDESFEGELLASGVQVVSEVCDITDTRQVNSMLDSITTRFGAIDGIVHSAGKAGGGLAVTKGLAESEAVLSAKMRGVEAIAAAMTGRRVGFVALFSSLSSITGVVGQVDYVAANAFLDSFARHLEATSGIKTVVLNWDTWKETGMAVRHLFGDEYSAQLLADGLSNVEGVDGFFSALDSSAEQVVISKSHPSRQPPKTLASILKLAAEKAHSRAAGNRPPLRTEYVEPSSPLEVGLSSIWSAIIGIDKIGGNDDFFELGGDSLLAIQIHSKLVETYGVEIPFQVLMSSTTIKSLAVEIENALITQLGG